MWYSCILKVAIHVPSKWKCLLPIKLLGPLWTPDYYPSLNLHCAISRNEKYRLGPNYTETHTPRHKSCQVQKCSMILWESVGNLPCVVCALLLTYPLVSYKTEQQAKWEAYEKIGEALKSVHSARLQYGPAEKLTTRKSEVSQGLIHSYADCRHTFPLECHPPPRRVRKSYQDFPCKFIAAGIERSAP